MIFDARTGFDPDDAMIAVSIAMAFGLGDVVLSCAALSAQLAAVFISYRSLRA